MFRNNERQTSRLLTGAINTYVSDYSDSRNVMLYKSAIDVSP